MYVEASETYIREQPGNGEKATQKGLEMLNRALGPDLRINATGLS